MFDRGSKDEHSACVHARAAMPTIVCVCGFVRIPYTPGRGKIVSRNVISSN